MSRSRRAMPTLWGHRPLAPSLALPVGQLRQGVNVSAPHLLTHLLSEDDLITSILLPRGTYRASVMGEPPVGSNVVFCGVSLFCIAGGTIVER
jgi:hypothetical protein